jgi:hypothetical protein
VDALKVKRRLGGANIQNSEVMIFPQLSAIAIL